MLGRSSGTPCGYAIVMSSTYSKQPPDCPFSNAYEASLQVSAKKPEPVNVPFSLGGGQKNHHHYLPQSSSSLFIALLLMIVLLLADCLTASCPPPTLPQPTSDGFVVVDEDEHTFMSFGAPSISIMAFIAPTRGKVTLFNTGRLFFSANLQTSNAKHMGTSLLVAMETRPAAVSRSRESRAYL